MSERDKILATIALAKMHGAKFILIERPSRDDVPKKLADVDLVVQLQRKGSVAYDGPVVWELTVFEAVAKHADLGDLGKPLYDEVLPAAREYLKRASDGDEELYL